MPLCSPRKTVVFLFCAYGLLQSCTGATSSQSPAPQGASGCEAKRNDNSKAQAYDLTASGNLWQDVKSVLQQQCTSCHAKFAEFDTASGKIDVFIKYTDLDEGEEGFMPKGAPKLSLEDRAKFIEWRAAGMPEDGGDGGGDITLGDEDGGEEGSDSGGDGEGEGGADDSSGIDSDGSDWGDEPPPPPASSAAGC